MAKDSFVIDNSNPTSFRSGIKITVISLCLQIILTISKGIIGYFGGSYALFADAFHSFSDMISDIALIFGLKLASKPTDKNHNYGHGKIENYMAHTIGLLIVFIGVSIGYSAILRIISHEPVHIPKPLTIFAALFCIVSQEVLYHKTIKVGKKINSQSIIANAWHHRSDAITSLLALVGIALTIYVPALRFMDILMGCAISLMVIFMGGKIFWKALKDMIDTSPPKEIYDQITDVTDRIDGVINIHHIRARYYSSYIFLDAHILVKPTITVEQGHNIAHNVEQVLRTQFKDIIDVTIHVEPAT